jgi:transposase
VRALNRLELVREALRHVLDVLATIVPAWLQNHARPEWLERYTGRSDEWRLPKSKEGQTDLANTIGNDGAVLFRAIYSPRTPRWLRDVPAVETLRRVWIQNYVPTEDGPRWRSSDDGLPKASQFVSSPLDRSW